jgi:spore germination cell wall hydrolase CwlJ-like protein
MTSVLCLATAIFFEARSEGIAGKEAVANVIINRVHDDRYPDTVCGVVNEPRAFSYTHDGRHDDPTLHTGPLDQSAWVTSQDVAKGALRGNLMGIVSTHYHTLDVLPFWASEYSIDGVVGNHIFYTNETPYK